MIAGPPRISPFDFTENTIGQAARVVCSSGTGSSLAWLKDGRRIISGLENISIHEFQGVLVLSIAHLEPIHSGNYTCTAENQDGRSSYSAYLTVAAPPQWTSVPPQVLVLSESSADVICEATGYPEVNVTWIRNGGWFISSFWTSSYWSNSYQIM